MEYDGEYHHRGTLQMALRTFWRNGSCVEVGDDFVEQQQEKDTYPKADDGWNKGPPPHLATLLDGGDEQAPHRGCHHHSGGKTCEHSVDGEAQLFSE